MGFEILMKPTVTPKKSLGQNFFINKNLLNHIIDTTITNQSPNNKRIVEIGPGTGNFTRGFIEHGYQILTIEKDGNLAQQLTKNGIKTITNDFLLLDDTEAEMVETFSDTIFGSLPYNVSKNIIFTLAERYINIKNVFVIIQKEVAEKFAVDDNKLGVKIRANFTPKILIRKINPASFSPKPKVNSSFIMFTRVTDREIINQHLFKQYVDTVFKQQKKTIKNNLKHSNYNISLVSKDILAKRPAQLTYVQHISLYKKLTDRNNINVL
jgi:16S rRNA (adenine1518-N6/adenine1519-N6)-dimethyltransferase